MNYAAFLEHKTHLGTDDGFEPEWVPDFLFGFQAYLVEWALRKGRAALFADCGLGKTPIQLVWAENVRRHTGKPVLVLTPLAVSYQTEGEAAKFGIEAATSRDGSIPASVTITNYERLHYFRPEDFGGVVCDESSAIKSYDGERRKAVTEFLRKHRYRLLCTATAAPNDYIELGTSSEALGYLGYMDMLSRFFVNQQGNSVGGRFHGQQAQWRFKGHAEEPFWRWVSSWARTMRRPSDFGYPDDGFNLPDLIAREHVVTADEPREGSLFTMPANGIHEEREELRHTILARCDKAAELVAEDKIAVVWCQLNAEADRLTRIIPGAVQVSGADSVEEKESKLAAFGRGEVRVLVTKPIIGAWGLNWQHCNHMTFFPSHSYEQYYQAVRRSWRFGQTRPVTIDLVTTEGSINALRNIQRKAGQADQMFESLMMNMREALHVEADQTPTGRISLPSWL